ncbi:YhcH/YjgK/YiaL family protein [Mucilaginibacter sp.]|uniref:YhcH/YjgK/YiaL family protein n=1 Tax=Mucilaginibacter sp. TaxID=1882438 RepID=UPI0035BBFAB6
MKNLKYLILLFTAAILSNSTIAQSTASKDKKSAEKWVKKNEWRNGVKLKLHPSVNAVEFDKQYHADKALWDKVFTYLATTNLDSIAPGKYPIDGDKAFASVTKGPSKELDKAGWESHRKYIDLQYVIEGQEKIGVVTIDKATVSKPYNETSDGANYTAEGEYYTASPGTFFLFFPADVHRPNIKVDGFDVVKKIVIKIKVN